MRLIFEVNEAIIAYSKIKIGLKEPLFLLLKNENDWISVIQIIAMKMMLLNYN